MDDSKTVILRAPHRAAPTCDTAQTLPIGFVLHDFEIRGVLGVGGFGIVYRAWDISLEREVALKEYLPATLALRHPGGSIQPRSDKDRDTFETGLGSFMNEAKLLAQFDHPALVKVYRFWAEHGTAYMVMPLYKGQTLKAMLEQRAGTLSEREILDILIPIAQALGVMHEKQCIHRDISPENVIIQTPDQQPVLLDFGAARRTIGEMNEALTVILKASYAPVEQYAEIPGLKQGPWTDVYALASVAHWMLTGKVPPSAMGRMVKDNYLRLTEQTLPYSNHLLQAIDRALAVKPEDRTVSMEQFVLDITANEAPTSAKFNEMTSRPRRKTVLLVASFVILCLLSFAATRLVPHWILQRQPLHGKKPSPAAGRKPQAAPRPASQTLPPSATAVRPQEQLPEFDAFRRIINGLTHGEELTARATSPTLTIGKSHLNFTVQSLLSGYVTVYVFTTDGNLVQLIPNKRTPRLFLAAGQSLSLPPANDPLDTTGPAGKDEFLVLVSTEPRKYDALQMTDLYGFGLVQRLNATPENLIGQPECVNRADCENRYTAAWFAVREVP
ncbi:serine/threonine-protein kinase [Limnobacter litoralis]|uniref:Protein kinase domain-containing protein n=1 Tax=Limnobacter litoralis TaxID=481366 RepID=A0ABQ5YQ30_9BURK|nr:serine/threonine-protein kinase [Limnobacter litoralis]GLR25455.1 hypothetical protein GCM10007875_05430 [Limnobacter litoralis]